MPEGEFAMEEDPKIIFQYLKKNIYLNHSKKYFKDYTIFDS
jgi:hypothetical protein